MTTATLSPSSAKVKFRLAGGAQPLILLPVEVDGEGPFEFILDTGAGTSLLSSELGQKLGIKILGSKEGQSDVDVTAGVLQSFQVGGARIHNLAVVAADFFAMLNNALGAKLDGIVGCNFLRNYKVALDYPNETLSLFTP
ncbi:MAG TPA: retropepsin-like aspartic protease [Chthoniobacterales bacterium]